MYAPLLAAIIPVGGIIGGVGGGLAGDWLSRRGGRAWLTVGELFPPPPAPSRRVRNHTVPGLPLRRHVTEASGGAGVCQGGSPSAGGGGGVQGGPWQRRRSSQCPCWLPTTSSPSRRCSSALRCQSAGERPRLSWSAAPAAPPATAPHTMLPVGLVSHRALSELILSLATLIAVIGRLRS